LKRFHFPHRLHPALYAGIALILISALTRIGLAVYADASFTFGALFQVFLRGLWFDLAAAVFAVTPMVIWLAIAPTRLARTRLYRGVTLAAFFGAAFGLLVLAVAEWLFWEEFGARFNFIAVDYLLYTQEVIGNIWESYPVGRILIMLALVAAAATAATPSACCTTARRPSSRMCVSPTARSFWCAAIWRRSVSMSSTPVRTCSRRGFPMGRSRTSAAGRMSISRSAAARCASSRLTCSPS